MAAARHVPDAGALLHQAPAHRNDGSRRRPACRLCRCRGLRGGRRRHPARPVRAGLRRLVPGRGIARAAGVRQAEDGRGGDPRRRLEVGRSGDQLSLRAYVRHAPHPCRARGAERRADRTLRRAEGRIRQARCGVCRGRGGRRGDREEARPARCRARCHRRASAPLRSGREGDGGGVRDARRQRQAAGRGRLRASRRRTTERRRR